MVGIVVVVEVEFVGYDGGVVKIGGVESLVLVCVRIFIVVVVKGVFVDFVEVVVLWEEGWVVMD